MVIKKRVYNRLLLAGLSFFWSLNVPVLAAPLIINIDNPQFRRTVAAVPDFIVCDSLGAQREDALKFAKAGAKELRYLLDFTGLFNNIAPAAYNEALIELKKEECRGKRKYFGSKNFELPNYWKATGIESLTIGKIVSQAGGLMLEIRSIDVKRRRILLGKRFGQIGLGEVESVMRRYGNLLLEVYSGKPGIFSSKITFVGRAKKGMHKQVFVCDFDGSHVVQISDVDVPHVSPHWSPDGKSVTYTSYENNNPDLFLYDLATKRKRLISNYHGLNSGAQWSQNGDIIAYTGSKDGDSDIYYIDPNGGKRQPLIRGGGLDVDPTFSPDDRFLAFVSGRYGNPHIFLATLSWDSSKKLRVLSDTRLTYAGWYNSTPSWSPDGDKIIFAGYDKDINRYDIFMMNPQGKELERLTLQTGDNENPSFSPNGQLVVFQSNRIGSKNIKGVYQLWMMKRDGSGQIKINTGLYSAQTPDWSGAMYESSP